MQRLKNALPGMSSMPSFGSSGATYSHTEPPIDSDRTELISARRTALDGMLAALTSHHKTLSKVRMDPIGSGDKTNQLPVLWVGEIIGGASQELDRVRNADAATQDYGRALRALGESHLAMGRAQLDLNDALAMHVLDEFEQLQKNYKEYDKACKEADKARSAQEARLAALNKGGKEDGSERRLEIEYDVARESVQRLADNIEAGFGTEQRIIEQLLEAEIKHAEQHLTALQSCRGAFTSSGGGSGARTPSRSSPSAKLVPPRFSTRMARSHSDSIVRRPDVGSADREASARRSTISNAAGDEPSPDKKTRPDALKSRSRSGSMLGRFAPSALRGKKKKTEKAGEGEDEESDDLDAYKHEESDIADEPEASRSSTPSRTSSGSPVGSRRGTGLPTLSSLKNMSLGSNGSSTGYGSLVEDTSNNASRSSPATSPLAKNGVHRAPTFKRTQTAPTPSAFTRRGARYVEARWAFSTTASNELNLDKGDVIFVEREINADWWHGTITSVQLTSAAFRVGQEGMFPSAYCVPSQTGGADDELDFGRIKSRDTTYSNLSAEPDTATEDDGDESESDLRQQKVGLRDAGGAVGQSVPKKMPPPPPRRRTGESSPFAG